MVNMVLVYMAHMELPRYTYNGEIGLPNIVLLVYYMILPLLRVDV